MSDQHTVESLNDKLSTLMEMAALVNSNHNLQMIVSRAVTSVCRLTNAETGSLILLDADSGELQFEVILGQQSTGLKNLRIPKGQGIRLSKELGLYRQQYCGCIYSEKGRYLPREKQA